ncbi:hypothetical protein NADE_003313 [Nannochloris sp. 'desiccata']|nr:hypothetical protein NADE_003313 [Chlorella desiccata (nom. nud.)]
MAQQDIFFKCMLHEMLRQPAEDAAAATRMQQCFRCCSGRLLSLNRSRNTLAHQRYTRVHSSSFSSSSNFPFSKEEEVEQISDSIKGDDASIDVVDVAYGATPDLILPPPEGGADIYIFGVMHADPEGWETGEFILKNKPHTVVVETALNPAHGSATGNVASVQECLMITNSAYGMVDARTRALAHIGVQLADVQNPIESDLWKEICRSPMFFSEHLAYAAAFAVGAQLIHGDRPKLVTYQRMLWQPSIVDLDYAFGLQSALNYHDLVAHMRPPTQDPAATGMTEQILIGERDAVLLQSLYTASLEAGAGAAVVGVVGSSHLGGMRRLWATDGWREVIASGALELPKHCGQGESPEQIGVRRALFDGVIRLTCRIDVTNDIYETLGPPPEESFGVYDLTHELYGSSRMLLATLGKDQLEEVCQGWRCDMWEVLTPLREIRPVNGGRGYEEELVMQLRQLNYEIT